MRSLVRCAAVVGSLLLGGCANHFRVSMTPAPEGLRREIACWREGTGRGGVLDEIPFPADRLARIAGAYGKVPPSAGAGPHVFQGVFADRLPDDVGGAGVVLRTSTTLGTAWRYVERFGGETDPVTDVERRFRAADRISEFLAAWLATEVGGQPGWDRLKGFLQGPLRRDLKAIALLDATTPEAPTADAPETEHGATLTLFLLERGYVRPAEAALLENGGHSATRRLIARAVARRMGVEDTASLPASLSFLLGEDGMRASLAAFSSSPFVERLWNERAAETPALQTGEEPGPSALALLAQLVFVDLLALEVLGDFDVVEVSLACGVEPIETNGDWRSAEGRVVWPAAVRRERCVRGLLRHAAWAAPDESAQRARFGRVVLEGKALADYARWRAGLSPAHGAEWDRALGALSPGVSVTSALGTVRLRAEDGTDLAEEGRAILEEALHSEE